MAHHHNRKEFGNSTMTISIRIKLLAIFLLAAAMLGSTGIIAFVYMQTIDRSYSDLVNRRALILRNAQEIQVEATQINSTARDYLLTRNSASLENMKTAVNQVKELIAQTSTKVQSAENKQALQEMAQSLQSIEQAMPEFANLVQTSQVQSLSFATEKLFPLTRDIREKSDRLVAYQLNQMEQGSQANTATVQKARNIVLAILTVSLAVALGLALFVASRIANPLVVLTAAARQIADGDLTVNIPVVRTRDELENMSKAFHQMAANLRSLIQTVTISAEGVAASSQQLAASAEQSTQAAQQIAQTIQEIASGADNQAKGAEANSRAIQELASAIQRLVSSTEVMHESSLQAAEKAEHGSQLLHRLSEHMKTIQQTSNESSGLMEDLHERLSEIGNIVDLMREIATQTQLLSLNASIEAARAGEAGRGFAVVAGEVKKLANQSEQSAQTVAELLEDISVRSGKVAEAMRSGVREVDHGMHAVRDAEVAFADILKSVHQVEKEVQETSALSEQMAATSQQISAAMEQTVAIAEQTSASAQEVTAATEEQLASMEEVTASSAELSRTAQQLNDAVSRFRVN